MDFDISVLLGISNQEYNARVEILKNNNFKLAHYTSAKVALSIIDKKEIW